MNSPDNPSSNKNTSSTSFQDDLIDDLIDVLLAGKPSNDNLPSAKKTSNPGNKLTLDEETTSRELKSSRAVEDRVKPTLQKLSSEPLVKQSILPKKISPQLQIDKLDSVKQKIEALNSQEGSIKELVDSVNALIPLIMELLKFKLNDSKEGIIHTVVPILDQLIERRVTEDSQKMAKAIAKILPSAITEQINLSPEAIAKAIAPEIALSIKQQILLDENAISKALASEMGKSIKAQIELERDAMVDALYPVIGSTIAKYMVEVVQDINSKVESTLSPEGIKRKIRAKIQGVSEAELIFQESVGYRVRAVFLIDKDSGIVIQEIQKPGEKQLDSDMIAGMLTAIRSFANDCISSGSELDTIDYGDWQIPIEVAGYCYLAVVLTGEPSKQFRSEIRQILGEIVLKHGNAIQKYDGNMATVPPEIKVKLEQLSEPEQQKSSSSPVLLWLIAFILGIIFIPWGIINYRARVARHIERVTATQLDAAPELSVYRLDPQVSRGKLTVSGRLPSQYLRNQAAIITQKIAKQNNLQLENQIVTVDVPVNPSLVTGEIQRLTGLFNQKPEVIIETNYRPKILTIQGFILSDSARKNINEAFSKIPGVEQIILIVSDRLPKVEQRIYFESGSSQLNVDNSSKIRAIKDLLNQYPQLNLKLTVHSDSGGSIEINRRLGKERCQNVRDALVARGVESNRLATQCESPLLPSNTNPQATLSNRYVSFELFVPTNSN